MSIAVRGNYTTVRHPSTTVHITAASRKTARRYVVLSLTIVGLLCAYGYVYSTTLFMEHQVELNRTAIQAQLQLQESLLERDIKLTSPDRMRSAAGAIGMTANNTAVIGTLDSLH
jgi:3-dehydroquinate dehydratase